MAPIQGGTVCRVHGGSAPQVRAAAQRRLQALVDPAITTLQKLLNRDDAPAQQMAAVKEILERDGRIGAGETGGGGVNLLSMTWEEFLIVWGKRKEARSDDAEA